MTSFERQTMLMTARSLNCAIHIGPSAALDGLPRLVVHAAPLEPGHARVRAVQHDHASGREVNSDGDVEFLAGP
jgi:hypothetical protein